MRALALALALLVFAIPSLAQTDFAPHTMTNIYLPTPYKSHASTSDLNFLQYKAFDGDTSMPWEGQTTTGIAWIGIDLGVGLSEMSTKMTSDSAPSPYVASASSEFSSSLAFEAFDRVTSGFGSYWIGTGGGVDWLKLDLGSGTTKILGVYDIQVNTIPEAARAPKNWTMQGSNDNSTWTTVDTQTNQTSWENGQIRSYTCATQTTAYRYFRLNITANNGDTTYTQIDEMWLYESGTSPGLGTYSQKLGSYQIKFSTNGAEPTNRGPKDWTVQGSNDGQTWTTVDTQTSQTSWTTGLLRSYTAGSPSGTAFRFWRLNITANNGSTTNVSIGELYLSTPAPAPVAGRHKILSN